jgi:hypothetical protein
MDAREILTQHAKFYQSLVDHTDTPSTDAVMVTAAVLTLAHVMSQKKESD